jgi:hypothetical protein
MVLKRLISVACAVLISSTMAMSAIAQQKVASRQALTLPTQSDGSFQVLACKGLDEVWFLADMYRESGKMYTAELVEKYTSAEWNQNTVPNNPKECRVIDDAVRGTVENSWGGEHPLYIIKVQLDSGTYYTYVPHSTDNESDS